MAVTGAVKRTLLNPTLMPACRSVTAIAFSNAFLVMIMRGVMPRRSRLTMASPAMRASLSRRPSIAGGEAAVLNEAGVDAALSLLEMPLGMFSATHYKHLEQDPALLVLVFIFLISGGGHCF